MLRNGILFEKPLDRTSLKENGEVPHTARPGNELNSERGYPFPGGDEEVLKVLSLAGSYFEARGLNHMDAQDLAMETGLRWLAQLHNGRLVCKAWVYVVASNLLMDHFRNNGRQHRLLESYAAGVRSAGEEHRPQRDSWEETVIGLPPADQDLLLGHYVEGRNVKELAGNLKVSVSCVKERLHRARKRLHSRRANRPSAPPRKYL
jgi:RNA polymerase sigma factor (sigma-70 family)